MLYMKRGPILGGISGPYRPLAVTASVHVQIPLP
jgi:hypothetical protein